MKTRWLLMSGMLVALLLTASCKKGMLDVNEEFYVETNITVNGNDPAFVGQQLLDASATSEMINKYANTIKSIEILEVKYYLSYFNGSATQQINDGILQVADANGEGIYDIATLANVNLMAATTESSLAFDQQAVDRLSDLIKNDPHSAMIYLRGTVNETPVDFTVKVRFRVKMVAGVL